MPDPDWSLLAELRLADWAPRSELRVTQTLVERPLAPVIDVHNHLGRWLNNGEWMSTTSRRSSR